jgi:hypothetical protein
MKLCLLNSKHIYVKHLLQQLDRQHTQTRELSDQRFSYREISPASPDIERLCLQLPILRRAKSWECISTS